MTCRRFSIILRFSIVAALASISCAALAQGPAPDAPPPSANPVAPAFVESKNLGVEHKFWDRENYLLFAAVAAMNTADFAVTRANLQSGGRELNPVVRIFGSSTAGLAVNFIGETTGEVGFSYFLHKTGHHKLERMVPVVSFGSSVGAVSYGLTHHVAATNNAQGDMARNAGGFSFRIKIPLK